MLASGTIASTTCALPRLSVPWIDRGGCYVANDVAKVILRSDDLDLHDRLQQLDTSLVGCFTHRAARADFERQRGGVDVVVLAVDQMDLEIDDREADQRAGLSSLAQALLDGRDIFLRNVAALDSSKNWKPDPRSPGTTLILISPNCPEPPDCFL